MTTLGEAYPLEQARLRELLAQYRELGHAGTFGYLVIESILRQADKAAIEGDLPAMVRLYQEMKKCE